MIAFCSLAFCPTEEAEAAADPAAVKKAADIAQAILDAGGRVR